MARRKPKEPRPYQWIRDQFAEQGSQAWVTRNAPGFVRVGTLGALQPTPGLAAVLRPAVEAGMVAAIQEGIRRLEALPENCNPDECIEALLTMIESRARR